MYTNKHMHADTHIHTHTHTHTHTYIYVNIYMSVVQKVLSLTQKEVMTDRFSRVNTLLLIKLEKPNQIFLFS